MAMSVSTGGYITEQASDHATTDIAILLEEVNKYGDGFAIFRLQSNTGLQPNTPVLTKQTLDLTNLMNADNNFTTFPVTKAACIKIKLPRAIRRQFRTKFIPPGTRFICNFTNNDLSKPIIIGIEYEASADVEIGGKVNEEVT